MSNGYVSPIGSPYRVTQEFGVPVNYSFAPNRVQRHEGLDLAPTVARNVYVPARAISNARVIRVGNQGNTGYGQYVEIELDNGLRALYGHLDSINVRAGQRVTAGYDLGNVGNTGRSTGRHLHFNIIDSVNGLTNWVYDRVANPRNYLSFTGNPTPIQGATMRPNIAYANNNRNNPINNVPVKRKRNRKPVKPNNQDTTNPLDFGNLDYSANIPDNREQVIDRIISSNPSITPYVSINPSPTFTSLSAVAGIVAGASAANTVSSIDIPSYVDERIAEFRSSFIENAPQIILIMIAIIGIIFTIQAVVSNSLSNNQIVRAVAGAV